MRIIDPRAKAEGRFQKLGEDAQVCIEGSNRVRSQPESTGWQIIRSSSSQDREESPIDRCSSVVMQPSAACIDTPIIEKL